MPSYTMRNFGFDEKHMLIEGCINYFRLVTRSGSNVDNSIKDYVRENAELSINGGYPLIVFNKNVEISSTQEDIFIVLDGNNIYLKTIPSSYEYDINDILTSDKFKTHISGILLPDEVKYIYKNIGYDIV